MKSNIEKLAKAITKFIDKCDSNNQHVYKVHFGNQCYRYKNVSVSQWDWILGNEKLASSYLQFANDNTITVFCEESGMLADLVHDRGNPFVDYNVLKKFNMLLEKYGFTYWSYDYYFVLISLK